MTQKNKDKAKVYIWPLLNEHDFTQVEDQCVDAGYTNKRKVKVGKVVCWEVS